MSGQTVLNNETKRMENPKIVKIKMSSHQIHHWFRCWGRFPLAVQFPFSCIKWTHQSVKR